MEFNFFCKLRELQLELEAYEKSFQQAHNLTLKEGMLLCCVSEGEKNAGTIAAKIDLSCSNCSKIITAVEKKGFLSRSIGSGDKRNMLFELTERGQLKLKEIIGVEVEVPNRMKSLLINKL